MTAWIQRSDYSSEETTIFSVDEAAEILRRFDWKAEISREEMARAQGDDCCPAGLGLVSDSGQILHIIPGRDGMATVHYHYAGGWTGESLVTVGDFPLARARSLMECHLAGDGNQKNVLAILQANGKPLN